MPLLHKTEAIVLKKKQLLQKDMLITLLTEELGKITAIAKGLKNITSRRSPHIQTGNLIDVELAQKNDIFYLQQSHLISGFQAIKNDQTKLNILYTFFFIINKILPDTQKEESVYKVTKSFLIDATRTATVSVEFIKPYLQRTLQVLGYLEQEQSFTELITTTEEIINEKIPLHVIM